MNFHSNKHHFHLNASTPVRKPKVLSFSFLFITSNIQQHSENQQQSVITDFEKDADFMKLIKNVGPLFRSQAKTVTNEDLQNYTN